MPSPWHVMISWTRRHFSPLHRSKQLVKFRGIRESVDGVIRGNVRGSLSPENARYRLRRAVLPDKIPEAITRKPFHAREKRGRAFNRDGSKSSANTSTPAVEAGVPCISSAHSHTRSCFSKHFPHGPATQCNGFIHFSYVALQSSLITPSRIPKSRTCPFSFTTQLK